MPECESTGRLEFAVPKFLAGDGKSCTECGKGAMKTREFKSKTHGFDHKMLICTNYPSCKYIE